MSNSEPSDESDGVLAGRVANANDKLQPEQSLCVSWRFVVNHMREAVTGIAFWFDLKVYLDS